MTEPQQRKPNPAPELVEWDERQRGAPTSKEVRNPLKAVTMARRNPGKAALYSEGHTKLGARNRAKRINRGTPAVWGDFLGTIRAGAFKEPDGTYTVRITWIEPEGSLVGDLIPQVQDTARKDQAG